ncbi:S8 family peptidase [Christiangramia forsetii]|uniref:Secreted subtilase family protein n=2 Tax=Christiangramia forsetii TaxID=411153 RepID=A0M6L7_CHRFK|nr:S8 family peptidase [Christiangramia forsetii]GGG30078.1 peptidase S8 [Christiangramia forsetii]CAL68262.1 secreted subtilase family protein [Christiangramia forsetii KT0803]
MKIPFFKPFLSLIAAGIITGCSSTAPRIVSTPVSNIDSIPLKVRDLSDAQLKDWTNADLVNDTIPGMSVNKAYAEIIRNNKPSPVIVGVVDSGVDIEHEDLKSVIWHNEDEIPGNGKDDDNNGYIDDIHGWNFLGDAVEENMEYTRIYKRLQPKYDGKAESSISTADREEFNLYKAAKAEYDKEYAEAIDTREQYVQIQGQISAAHEAVSAELGTEDYTKEQLSDFRPQSQQMTQYKSILSQIQYNVNENIPEALTELEEAIDYYKNRLATHFNMKLDGRAKVGDDPYDITDTDYGNNEVSGPDPKKEDVKHGTHVAGIIAADRSNNIGLKGVSNNAKILVVRAVPDGDEYDKDIALGIRYAVDNGAKVINTSFGKYFSPNPEWVIDAIKYAAENDVLIVNAAGNEGIDLDKKRVYPNDQDPENSTEIADNFLSVGALNYEYGSGLVSDFSNYGKSNVDVFAPGTKIWSTTPNNTYEYLQGTSMASPAVAGIAAIIRGYYPQLTAPQVKQVIMDSGLTTKASVIVGGDTNNTKKFESLSTSGKMANLYNALILADQISKNN